MPTIIAPNAPLSTAAGVNAAIVDEKLTQFWERSSSHGGFFCCFRIALALLVVRVVAQSPPPFT
jgi:hypothetical protein